MTANELEEPIIVTLTPINAEFTLCLSPTIITKAEGAERASSYTWCTNTLT
jgi:hypothetical protein